MFRRPVLTLALVLASLVLAACSTGTENPPPPPPGSQQATVEEAVESANNLFADLTAVMVGFSTNDTLPALMIGLYECGSSDVELFPVSFPAVAFYMADWDSEIFDYVNLRPAHGTFSYNPSDYTWDYSEEPSDALVCVYPEGGEEGGVPVEVRFAFSDVQEATAYSLMYLPTVAPGDTIQVPGSVRITVKKGDKTPLDFTLEQTLADTTCGLLAEARTLSVTGGFGSGAQQFSLATFALDHSVDGHLSVTFEGTFKSGSVTLPAQFAGEFDIEGFTRDETTCEIASIENLSGGSVEFSVGSGVASVGASASFSVTFDEIEGTSVSVDDVTLTFGGKTVEVTVGETLADVVLTFADDVSLSLEEFLQLLTLPSFGIPII